MAQNRVKFKLNFYLSDDPNEKQDWYIHGCGEYLLGASRPIYNEPPPPIRIGHCLCGNFIPVPGLDSEPPNGSTNMYHYWATMSFSELQQSGILL